MTIAERQQAKNRLASEHCFEADRALLERLLPRHPLHRELRRVNRVNRLQLEKQIVWALLQVTTPEVILQGREPKQPDIPKQPDKAEEPDEPKEPTKNLRTKQQEFPAIDWDRNTDPDIQLCILLYDERVNTFHRMQQLRGEVAKEEPEKQEKPEALAKLAELDDRNRLAQQELETFAATGQFAMVHPIAKEALADRTTRRELEQLKADDPAAFLKRVANARQNQKRIQSRIDNKKYDSAEQLAAWQQNLKKAKHLLALMEECI